MVRYNLGVTERTGVISRIWEWPDHPMLSDCEIEGFDGIVALHDIEEILAQNAPDTPPCAAGSPGSPRPARPARLPS